MTEPTVLHDRQWLVLNKPAGWHCVETKNTDGRPVVETWLREQFDACREPEAGLCHRLDLGTTGCLVVANGDRSGNVCRAMSGDPAASGEKTYLALVAPGLPPVGRFELFFGHEARVRTSETGQAEQQGYAAGN